jgi:hypothetical protein
VTGLASLVDSVAGSASLGDLEARKVDGAGGRKRERKGEDDVRYCAMLLALHVAESKLNASEPSATLALWRQESEV